MNVIALDFTACQPDVLILTPNRRLSAWLIRDHDTWMLQQGAVTWPRLDALPLDRWLQRLFEQISLLPGTSPPPRLLSPRQSSLIWRQIVEKQDSTPDAEGFAALAEQARALVQRWCLPPAQWQQGERIEQQYFAQWHREFRERLSRDQLLDGAGLCDWIVAQGAAIKSTLPRQIFLHGFNDPEEPQLQRLVRWLQDDGIDVHFSNRPPNQSQNQVAAFPQVDAQFCAAIQWALHRRQPGQRIAIVMPGLQSRRAQVRQWCQSLWSQQQDATEFHWSDQINISAGQPLADYPLVAHLLLLLRALESELSVAEWGVLLSSPYFPQDENEWLRRDDFIQTLREKNLRRLTLARLESRWQQIATGQGITRDWLARLQTLKSRARQQTLLQ
ncbi:MAG TPA: hypothetical protein VM553_19100, partial [Dongiaceae bacterium]|nr:hypothetical protein [Dongiaceae bacterium]